MKLKTVKTVVAVLMMGTSLALARGSAHTTGEAEAPKDMHPDPYRGCSLGYREEPIDKDHWKCVPKCPDGQHWGRLDKNEAVYGCIPDKPAKPPVKKPPRPDFHKPRCPPVCAPCDLSEVLDAVAHIRPTCLSATCNPAPSVVVEQPQTREVYQSSIPPSGAWWFVVGPRWRQGGSGTVKWVQQRDPSVAIDERNSLLAVVGVDYDGVGRFGWAVHGARTVSGGGADVEWTRRPTYPPARGLDVDWRPGRYEVEALLKVRIGGGK